MRLVKRIWKHRVFRGVARYSLPFLSILAALLTQGVIQHLVPPGTDFPYAFFYLLAAFACAWYGGYLSGALACLFTMLGLPLMVVHFSKLPPVDISRLVLFIGISLMI